MIIDILPFTMLIELSSYQHGYRRNCYDIIISTKVELGIICHAEYDSVVKFS